MIGRKLKKKQKRTDDIAADFWTTLLCPEVVDFLNVSKIEFVNDKF